MLRKTCVVTLLALTSHVGAMAPPPRISTEQWICSASHIVSGRATNFRVVTPAKGCGSWSTFSEALNPCQFVEVDIEIQAVVKPIDWKPSSLTYQFGGGLFSIKDLRNDLDGKELLFLMKPLRVEAGNEWHGPAYPWRLAMPTSAVAQVIDTLPKCSSEPK